MDRVSAQALAPRKKPVQARSAVTVEAINEATVQVLLQQGAERLTTVRVAERAGVSVGTLYQYYPNKQALLFAVLDRHLRGVADAVVGACEQNHGQPLRLMVEAVVHAFVNAKLERRDTSLALYRIAADLDGEALSEKFRKRTVRAMVGLLQTAPEGVSPEIDFAAFMFLSAMAGTMRALLEAGAPVGAIEKLRRHLVAMGWSYLKATELPRKQARIGSYA